MSGQTHRGNPCYDLQGYPTELTPGVIRCSIVRILERVQSMCALDPKQWTAANILIYQVRGLQSVGTRLLHDNFLGAVGMMVFSSWSISQNMNYYINV